jgi:photosystem II stability/assembly factor-like uncharacterized protein
MNVSTITPQPGGRAVYAVVNYVGLYRTYDDGATWQFLSSIPYFPKGFVICRDNPNVMYYIAYPLDKVMKSADGGLTWNPISSPPDGNDYFTAIAVDPANPNHLVVGGYPTIKAYTTTDGGQSWDDESLVAVGHNETTFAILPGGRMIAAARSESGHVAILFSDDAGRTWSNPQQVTRDGEHPADLTVLQSGTVQLTFGRRIRPMGCGVLFSDDGGRTWDHDHEVLLAGDGVQNGDLGYPSTVQLADGHLVTVLYYASGSEMSGQWGGWGEVSCQAIHYREEDVR